MDVQIDEHLKWNSHVSYLCKKMAYYLYLISRHHKVLPMFILKLLVESLVLSHLNYALPVWGPAFAHILLAWWLNAQSCYTSHWWIEKI